MRNSHVFPPMNPSTMVLQRYFDLVCRTVAGAGLYWRVPKVENYFEVAQSLATTPQLPLPSRSRTFGKPVLFGCSLLALCKSNLGLDWTMTGRNSWCDCWYSRRERETGSMDKREQWQAETSSTARIDNDGS